ncbi:uncharacterized protein LOC101711783 isoform X2 [Heterocephalus glaber]|uniref:Uncharacterized protein LOC101711783 isoform X2 n=1 Tax=Heterocephalus glaber TaxID=10181 RepID=A0AAX6S4B0_HETGA|nr:uncharacterized protein LOC101711783 isoform X2 [Heterocephalus glaber]
MTVSTVSSETEVHRVFLSEGEAQPRTPAHDLTSLVTGPNRPWNPVTRHHGLAPTALPVTWLEIGSSEHAVLLSQASRPQPRTPRRETTCQRVRGWFTRPRSFRTLIRNHPTVTGSPGQVSPDPAPRCPETRESPGQVSRGLTFICSEAPNPLQVYVDLDTTMGNQYSQSLAEGCTASKVQANALHTLTEAPEQDFLDRKSRSTSSVLDSSLELNPQVDSLVPAPASDEVPPADLLPTPPAAPSPALAPQREPTPGTSSPAAELELLVAQQQISSLELYREVYRALDPHPPFPSLTDLLIIVFIATLISQR